MVLSQLEILSSAYLCSDLHIPVPWKKIPKKFTMPRASDNLNLNTRWLEIPHAISKASHSMQISFKCLVATKSKGHRSFFFADKKKSSKISFPNGPYGKGIEGQQVKRGGFQVMTCNLASSPFSLAWNLNFFGTFFALPQSNLHPMSEEEISLNPNNTLLLSYKGNSVKAYHTFADCMIPPKWVI